MVDVLSFHPLRDAIRSDMRLFPPGTEGDVKVAAEELTPLEIRHTAKSPSTLSLATLVLPEGVDGDTVLGEKVLPFLSLVQVEARLIVERCVVVEQPLDGLDVLDVGQRLLKRPDRVSERGELCGEVSRLGHGKFEVMF